MKPPKIRFGMACALVAMFAVGTPANVYGQAIPPAKIAILEFQRVMLESAAANDIKVQVDQRRQLYQAEITKQEQELRDAEQELSRQATILAPDALAQKRREFEGRVAELQTGMQARKRELDQSSDASTCSDNLSRAECVGGARHRCEDLAGFLFWRGVPNV